MTIETIIACALIIVTDTFTLSISMTYVLTTRNCWCRSDKNDVRCCSKVVTSFTSLSIAHVVVVTFTSETAISVLARCISVTIVNAHTFVYVPAAVSVPFITNIAFTAETALSIST